MHKLLVVDDDEYIRDLYEEILKDSGFHVETAVDGKDGLDKIIDGSYDIILLDIMMPKMDGVEVLRELSKKAKGKAEKVILLTNLAHDPVMKEALDLGAKAYLIKADMTPDQLVEKIKGYLK
jgi:DNA-binding response OmpR family regulator